MGGAFSRSCLLLLSVLVFCGFSLRAADLVIAENGSSLYQIVIPDQAVDEVVGTWLSATAQLMQTAFSRNGVEVPVVRESARIPDKPGIYLGATDFAKKNQIELQTNDWTYVWKVVGQDLVIVGSDRMDEGVGAQKGSDGTLYALLGTVKGSVDFMREYLGVRFLFNTRESLNVSQSRGGDESHSIDTRSIGFVPVQRVVVPSDLELRKTAPLQARTTGRKRASNFFSIANNEFPSLFITGTQPQGISWQYVIPAEKYGESHPEYYALMPDGRRASERRIGERISGRGQVPLDITNPEVLDLMCAAVENAIEVGNPSVLISPLDSFRSTQCNCDRCNAFFGMSAKTPDLVRARGKTGKMWQIYFQIAERVGKKYPDAKIIVWDYQEHHVGKDSVQKFPKNVIPQVQIGAPHGPQGFDRLEGIDIPAGIMALEETFTGFNAVGPYAPEHTPEYASLIAQSMVKYNVRWGRRDGGMTVWGMQAPVYYVYGRTIDDTTVNFHDLETEFYTAAFGDVVPQMTAFFDLLHKQLDLFSDFFALYQPAWTPGANARYARTRDNKWHHQSIYTVEFIGKADALLTQAQERTKDPDVKARLDLIRVEFDYLSGIGKIFALQDAWELNPSTESLAVLVDQLNAWHGDLRGLAGGIGDSLIQPLEDWPEMRPIAGTAYRHAALEVATYQNSSWQRTSLNWDTAAMEGHTVGGKYVAPTRATAKAVGEAPDIESSAWEATPVTVLTSGGMPMTTSRTSVQVLYDKDTIYLRFDNRISTDPSRAIVMKENGLLKPKAEKEVFKQENVEVKLQVGAGGSGFHFAGNPVEGLRYDAILKDEKEDVSWNGKWKFEYKIERRPKDYTHWVAWLAIPFSDLGVSTPSAGDVWKFSAARKGDAEGDPRWAGELGF